MEDGAGDGRGGGPGQDRPVEVHDLAGGSGVAVLFAVSSNRVPICTAYSGETWTAAVLILAALAAVLCILHLVPVDDGALVGRQDFIHAARLRQHQDLQPRVAFFIESLDVQVLAPRERSHASK